MDLVGGQAKWRCSSHRFSPHAWRWYGCWLSIVAGGLILRVLESPYYVFGSKHDDQLMVQMATGFLHGHWSSNWSTTGSLTLAKPVGYPLLLAGAHFLPWSPLVSGYLLYLLGTALIVWSWMRMSGSRGQATVILAALVFNPIHYEYNAQRVYREVLTNDIATLAIGLSFVVAANLASEIGRAQSAHLERSGSFPAGWSVTVVMRRSLDVVLLAIAGGIVGIVLVTKPTWQWCPVAVAAPLVWPVAKRIHRSPHRTLSGIRTLLAALVAVTTAGAVVVTTKFMNDRTYGVSLVEDFSTGAFARAWRLWAAVQAGPARRYVPITKEMRLAVYTVSPTAALMRSYLESSDDPWKNTECSSGIGICDESGAYFEWDLRDAAVATGRIHSVRDMQKFFSSVADDIARACGSGRLRCSSSPVIATGLPPLDQISAGAVASHTAGGLWKGLWNGLEIRRPGGVSDRSPTPGEYRLWQSVVPGMVPADHVLHGTSPLALYPVLRFIDGSYRVFNLLLLIGAFIGALSWLDYRRRAQARARHLTAASVASVLFLLSGVIGMGTLAVFQIGQAPGYISPLYWADFASPVEMFLVFAALAAWPRSTRHHSPGAMPKATRAARSPFRVASLACSEGPTTNWGAEGSADRSSSRASSD